MTAAAAGAAATAAKFAAAACAATAAFAAAPFWMTADGSGDEAELATAAGCISISV